MATFSHGGKPGSFRNVSHRHPCPVCGRGDWCSLSEDGEVCLCRRISAGGEERIDSGGATYYLHRLNPSTKRTATLPLRHRSENSGGQRAGPEVLHQVYSALLDALSLDAHHVGRLHERGLRGDLRAAGYRSLHQRGRYHAVQHLIAAGLEQLLPGVPGFSVEQGERGPYWTVKGAVGLLIPIRDVEERIVALSVRADFVEGKQARYTFVSSKKFGGPGPGAPVHITLFTGDKSVLRITEGALKADITTNLSGILTIGLAGLTWQSALPVVRRLGSTRVKVALDADARRNPNVSGALVRLVRDLRRDKNLIVELEVWDESGGKGIDDLLAVGKAPRVLTGEDVVAATEEIDRVARRNIPPDAGRKNNVVVIPTKRRGHFILRTSVEVF
jgi:hypothetical protein